MKPNYALMARLAEIIKSPMTYPEIEALIPPRTNPFSLGLTLTYMVNKGKLYHKAPGLYSSHWPLYSNKPVRGRACPSRKHGEVDG